MTHFAAQFAEVFDGIRLSRGLSLAGLLLAVPMVLGENPVQLPPSADRPVDFVADIQPIFEKSCTSCHGEKKQKGSLRLDVKSAALKGGDLGPAILPGRSAESPLIHFVAGLDEDMLMPNKGDRLTPGQIGVLRAWIDQGAKWPDGVDTAQVEDPLDWWSLRPLQRPGLPDLKPGFHNRVRNPIDTFVLARLQDKELVPASVADRRTLIRRLYFDMTGLPPSPQAVQSFVDDPDPRGYEKLVDELLDSPHYGERWARHWLDVVHYGDTHGYDKDKLRPNAWPYRDYVIRAFNEDKPYSRFVQEQIAGDVMFPGTVDGIEALGFIAAGPWDFIGHAEVPETKIDGRIARHMDRDDMVSNTINTFNSLTAQCAQCHNHKFDPIRQEDYYNLHAVFAAVDRTNIAYDRDPEVARKRHQLREQQQDISKKKNENETKITQLGGEPLAALDRQIRAIQASADGGKRPEFGYHSTIESDQNKVKWVQLDLGREIAISKILYAPCYDDFNNIRAGFGFPLRFKIQLCNDPEFRDGVTTVVKQTPTDFPNPGIVPQTAVVDGNRARYVRLTATKLAPRQNDYIFALSELEVHDEHGTNVARGVKVTSLDSIEAPVRWARKNLVDGIYPGLGLKLEATDLAQLQKQREVLLDRVAGQALRGELASFEESLAGLDKEMKALPAPSMVYAGAIHNGSGAFRGTGPDGGKPRTIHVLYRGDIQSPGPESKPAGVAVLSQLTKYFELPENHNEGERRAALAQWLTDRDNPLTWRSIVNRVWLYHFGRGIVDSPNDFGRMGQPPTHPELLDWLAVEFRDGGQSIKQLHRLILNSATYRQASTVAPGPDRTRAEQLDADNALLWRMNRRRLEAEAIRDSVLFVSGKMDARMYGPGFQDFIIEKPEHSPHYQYHLHDPDDPKTHRRSVYRFIVRSQQQPFMTTLDCADPSMLVDKRTESLSALQALALLNNGLMLTMSKHFAASLEEGGGDLDTKLERGFFRALSREPLAEEKDMLKAYASQNGLANTCRLLFNLNEFVFVD